MQDFEPVIFLIQNKFQDFIKSPLRNTWIETDQVKIYLRKSHRHFNPEEWLRHSSHNCLDIANIEILNQEFWGQGLCSILIKFLVEISPYPYIILEQVMDVKLQAFANKYNWTEYYSELDGKVKCYYIKKEKP